MSRSPVKQAVFGDLEHELASTRRVLERVPEERFGWQPHEKSMSLGALATHVANLAFWQVGILRDEEYDLAASPAPRDVPPTRAELLATWDRNVEELRRAVEECRDADLGADWTLRSGDHVIFTLPRGAVLRNMGISHMIHHRGQLTVYLRLLDVPVPGVYGPSADEKTF